MTEITQISTTELTTQVYNPQDVGLVPSFEVDTNLKDDSYIEYNIYDLNSNLLLTTYDYNSYTVLEDGQSAQDGNISQIIIDPESDLVNAGFDQGSYNTYYNFLNNKVGDVNQKLYIENISSDRTEIELTSNIIDPQLLSTQVSSFITERENSPYFVDFYINLGDNLLFIANNIQQTSNSTVLVKLYEPLPSEIELKTELWVVTQLENPLAYNVVFQEEPIIIEDSEPLKGPNFNLDLKDQINNSTSELSYTDLITTTLTSSQNQFNSLLEEKEIDINIDYTDFSDFIHFSSAKTRLENFYYKVNLIEQYSSSISTIDSSITGPTSSSLAVSESKAILESRIDDIITNFDGYDYYLYYESGSWAWPKTTTTKPYTLATVGSAAVINWYENILISASNYDDGNKDFLKNTIPEYLREDQNNAPYELFIDMVAQHYDNIWIYYKDVTQKFNADNRLEFGVSKDIVGDAIRDFGVKLYQNNFSNKDLYTAFLGLTPEGNLFPFPNITSSLPTPTGYEYVDTLISASNDSIPLDDVNKSLYKRLYHNLPYLLKSKGTIPGLRALITTYGIPDTILKISEFGGKDKVNINDWDYWYNKFNYAFSTSGSNHIKTSFQLNESNWNLPASPQNKPRTVEFRFKAEAFPPTNLSQSLWNISTDSDAVNSTLTLEYSGTGLTSGSYSGSIVDPYYRYADLKFYPSTSDTSVSASVYLPFFNEGWWSVMITSGSNGHELYASNKIDTGNDGSSIGYIASSSITSTFDGWSDSTSTTSYFASQSLYPGLSGSLQEVRYYNTILNENSFKDYVMNPLSIEGNDINSSPNQLAFRASLGSELDNTQDIILSSIHPKITGSWEISQSFSTGNSNIEFKNTASYNSNTEHIFLDQPIAGIKNRVTDKVRVEDNVVPAGDTLSPFIRVTQQTEASASYTPNINLLEVAFSPQNEINDDIINQLGYFNIGDYIGDPNFRTNPNRTYPDLDTLRNEYFKKYIKNYNVYDFVNLIKYFDNSLFKMIKDFVPARTSLATGVVIKQHLLERNRYQQPLTTFQTNDYSASVKPQWNDYEDGKVYNPVGTTGGSFDIFNGVTNNQDITQSWNQTIPTISGSVNVVQSSQDEFYNGELEGTQITVTTQSLAQPLALDLQGLSYNTSGSTDTNPSPGNLTWQSKVGFGGTGKPPITYSGNGYVSSIYINEVDENGINIQTALSNLSPGDKIKLTVSGSYNETFDIPYVSTVEGTIETISSTSTSVWKLKFSDNPILQATYYSPILVPSGTNTLGNFPSSPIFIDPFNNSIPNFYNSDFNAIINNVEDTRLSIKYQDVDYNSGVMSPTNFNLLLDNGALKAPIQDSNYSLTRHTNPRYNGSRSTSQNLNTWTVGDTGTFGKQPNIENLDTTIFEFAYGGGTYPEIANGGAILLNQAINVNSKDDVQIIPTTDEHFDEILQRKFLLNTTPNITQYTSTSNNDSGANVIGVNIGVPPQSNYILPSSAPNGITQNESGSIEIPPFPPLVSTNESGYYITGSQSQEDVRLLISSSLSRGESWYVTLYNTLPDTVQGTLSPFNSGSLNNYNTPNSEGEYPNLLGKNGVYQLLEFDIPTTSFTVSPTFPETGWSLYGGDKGILIWKAIDRKDITFDEATLSGVGKGAITTTTTSQTVEENLQYITKTYGTNT